MQAVKRVTLSYGIDSQSFSRNALRSVAKSRGDRTTVAIVVTGSTARRNEDHDYLMRRIDLHILSDQTLDRSRRILGRTINAGSPACVDRVIANADSTARAAAL